MSVSDIPVATLQTVSLSIFAKYLIGVASKRFKVHLYRSDARNFFLLVI